MRLAVLAVAAALLAPAGCAGPTGTGTKDWFGPNPDPAVTRPGPHGPFRGDPSRPGGDPVGLR